MEEDDKTTIWLFAFYENAMFFGLTAPKVLGVMTQIPPTEGLS
jgi:hypothetical protein